MKYYQKALFDEMVSFYLVTANDEGDELGGIRARMGGLVRKARQAILPEEESKLKIHKLLQLVYGDWGFCCDPNSYFQSCNLYINQVLKTRQGMPVSLGAIVLYLADSLNLSLYPVNFPTQLILRAEANEQVAFIDPWDGKYINRHKLQQLYEGAFGFGAEFGIEKLAVANESELLNRFTQLAKRTLIREGQSDAALKYLNMLIRRYPQNPYEIRDRGLVLAQMGCYHSAIEDLQYFIEQRPDDSSVLLLISQLSELKQKHYSIH